MNILVDNLHKSFKTNHVLHGISVDIQPPGIIALLGPNGSGKTTLIKCILGLNQIDEGQIFVNGSTIAGANSYRKHIGHLPQIANFPENLSPTDLIIFIKDLQKGRDTREEELIDLFQLGPEMNKKMAQLSGGNRQKVNLVLALLYDNPVLVLDEPTSGLDPVAIIRLKAYLEKERQKNKLILLTTHIIPLVEEIAQHIIFLLEGQIYFDGPLLDLLKQTNTDFLEQAIASILDPGFIQMKKSAP